MLRHLHLLALLLLTAPLMAVTLTVQTESRVSLSLAQEAENAIDRAQRWVRSQPCECQNAVQRLLHKVALLPSGERLTLSEREVACFAKHLPAGIRPVAMEDLSATIQLLLPEPKALYALQRELPMAQDVPEGWREEFVRALVNAQKVTPAGGYWQDPPSTLWAIMTLRALLNEPLPIEVAPPAKAEL